MATEAQAVAACLILKRAIDAAENGNQAGEDAVVVFAAAPHLLRELEALVRAVRFADPPKMFNRVECHEARVPTAFVDGAEAAIALARGNPA